MKNIISLSMCLFVFLADAQESDYDPFAELDAEIKAYEAEGSTEEMAKFQQWKTSYLADYQKFREEHFNKLDDIRDNLISTWGQAEVSEQSKYVEYSEDNNTKTVVDFEKNEIRISVLHDSEVEVRADEASKKLTELIEKNQTETKADEVGLFESAVGGDTTEAEVKQLVAKAEVKQHEVIVENLSETLLKQQAEEIAKQTDAQYQEVEKIQDMLEIEEQGEVSSGQLEKDEALIKAEIINIKQQEQERLVRLKKKSEELKVNISKRDELANKKITTYTIPLKNKKVTEKAKPYFAQVKEEGKRFKLKPSLILAIIQTESYFNPKAKSHVPAYGLMQIVPRTAGVDVNRFLFDKDAPMLSDNLYVAHENIEAGSAYLHLLLTRYLKKIEDPQSRIFCAIAAYNTGSGNVAKTFNTDGSRNISKAAKIINALSPQEVFEQLVANLPYEETRHYLERVSSRRAIYTFLDEI